MLKYFKKSTQSFETNRIYVIHFNSRKNGGNLVLHRFASDLSLGLNYALVELSFSTNPYSVLYLILSKELIVFSNPILLLFFFFKKRAIHFIQSIDEDLFAAKDFGFLKARIFRNLFLYALKKSRTSKLFNSRFTETHYKRFNRSLGVYKTEHNLYFAAAQEFKNKRFLKSANQCVWIGTLHYRKGFMDLLAIAQTHPDFLFKCIMSGRVKEFDNIPQNVEIFNNLEHTETMKIIESSAISIITSSFESLHLPIYEGLLFKNKVIAKESAYLSINGVDSYITTYASSSEVQLDKLTNKEKFKFEDPKLANLILIDVVSNEI